MVKARPARRKLGDSGARPRHCPAMPRRSRASEMAAVGRARKPSTSSSDIAAIILGMTPEEHLAVPYVMVLESIEGPNGDWLRQASYPELPGLVARAPSPIEAIDRLE